MPTTATSDYPVFDATPELLEDMTRRDLVFVLQEMKFGKDGSALIRIDKPVRDYLVGRLIARH